MISIKTIFKIVALTLLGFSLMACQGDAKVKEPIANTFVQCKDPRPQMCTKEYRPVCAKKDTGIRCVTTPCPSDEDITYSNACTACTDSKVHGYTPGGACN